MSFSVKNDNESKNPSVALKILGWTITCNNQICIIYFLLASGITGPRPCFQFSNLKKSTKTDSDWTTESCFILSRVRRIHWAFTNREVGRSSKLKLKATNKLIEPEFDCNYLLQFHFSITIEAVDDLCWSNFKTLIELRARKIVFFENGSRKFFFSLCVN